MEMILLASHAPFTWGVTAGQAVYNSAVLEYIAKMAVITCQLNPTAERINSALAQKHFTRKHGPQAYYGQKKK